MARAGRGWPHCAGRSIRERARRRRSAASGSARCRAARTRRPRTPRSAAARAPAEHPYGVLVPGVSPRRALDDRYRDFFELAAEHIVAGIANAHALRGGAAPRGSARRARPREDRVLQQRQPRVPHAAHADARPARGRSSRARADALPAGPRDSWQLVHRNALRLLKLVNSLLDFSRIEAGRADAAYEPVDLAALTPTSPASSARPSSVPGCASTSTAPPLARAGVRRSRDVGEDRPQPALERAQVHVRGRDRRALRSAPVSLVELEVRDTGVGIPPTELPNVFKRFHRVQDARARTHEGPGSVSPSCTSSCALHGGDDPRRPALRIEGTTVHGDGPHRDRAPAAGPDRVHAACKRLRPPSAPDAFVEEALRWLPGAERDVPAAGDVIAQLAGNAAKQGRILVVDDNADMRAIPRAPARAICTTSKPQVTVSRRFAGSPAVARPDPYRRHDAAAGRVRAAQGAPRRCAHARPSGHRAVRARG